MIIQDQPNRLFRIGLALGWTIFVGSWFLGGESFAQTTERVSADSNGVQGNSWSGLTKSISADGRYVAFFSEATNLVPGDTNGFGDVFVHDRQTGVTERVSVATDGSEGNQVSSDPGISDDGRYVVFSSTATTLVNGDTNGRMDVFLHDRLTGFTQLVTVVNSGVQANGDSGEPSISGDGRHVAFGSGATNLVSDDTNGVSDVFVVDLQTHVIQRASVPTSGGQGNSGSWRPQISADGRHVAFLSQASNLVSGDGNGLTDAFVRDLQAGTTLMVTVSSRGTQGSGFVDSVSISRDGRYAAFAYWTDDLVMDDTNRASDIFVYDRVMAATQLVSMSTTGEQGNAAGVYPTLSSYDARISSDGRYVAFSSYADNLVAGDVNDMVDVFVHDRLTGVTELVATSAAGDHGDGSSYWSAISGNGRYVAFESYATNLVSDDTNGVIDVFVKDRGPAPVLTNISTRGWVGAGGDTMVGGFIITGTGTKKVLIRGFGPTLSSFGVTGALANPVLELYQDTDNNPTTPAVLLVSNDNWGRDVMACPAPIVPCGTAVEIEATGKSANSYAPTNPNRHLDAALLVTLPAGTYTGKLRGVSSGTGVGLVAVNDVDTTQSATLTNISTRAFVGTGSSAAVGGFIISGTGTKQVLLRGFGPTLTSFGITGALSNPTLDLYWDDDNNPNTAAILVLTNSDWGTALGSCPAPVVACGTPTGIANTGMSANSYAPTNPNRALDAALLLTLPPGTYTARLSGVSGGTGVGLIGVDHVGP
jgi:hypothetical protein